MRGAHRKILLCWAAIRLLATGFWSSSAYRKLNPDVPEGTIEGLRHFLVHGFEEGRFASSVAAHHVCLSRVCGSVLFDHPAASSQQITAQVSFFERYFSGDVVGAASFFTKLPPVFALSVLHKSLRMVSVVPDVAAALNHICAVASSVGCRLNDTELRDVEEALGIHTEQDAERVELAVAEPKAEGTPDWAQLRQAAVRNENNHHAWSDADPKAVCLILPDEAFFTPSDPTQQVVLQSFELILRAMGRRGVRIVPRPAVWARDLDRVRLPAMPTISYHTHAVQSRGILHFKESSIHGRVFFDEFGFGGAARIEPTASSILYDFERERSNYLERKLTKYQVMTEALDEIGGGYLLMALQVSDDYSSRWHKVDKYQMVSAALKVARERGLRVVIKAHPKERLPATEQFLRSLSDPRICVAGGELLPLLMGADVVLTANSGTGLEALLCDRPVVATAPSEYAAGCINAYQPGQLETALRKALDESAEVRKQRSDRFLSVFFGERSFSVEEHDEAFEETAGRYLTNWWSRASQGFQTRG